MCGDHDEQEPLQLKAEGSPPHVRGPPEFILTICELLGITPACAGTTYILAEKQRQRGDHPRMCGDHLNPAYIVNSAVGSPPHVRGPLLNIYFMFPSVGITPACAGTTGAVNAIVDFKGDHPRMCGDHFQLPPL